MEREPHSSEDARGSFSVNYMPACWRAEIEAARKRAAGGDAGETPAARRQQERAPFSFDDAWSHLAMMIGYIISMFGAPLAIAERLLLVRKSRRDILQWLGPVEALARRLLLLRALAAPPVNYAPPKSPEGRLPIAFTDLTVDDIHPDTETWRVRFCVMPHGVLRRKARGEMCTDRRGEGVAYNALPLARRLEALRRVLENPAPAIARLSRLLAARREDVAAAFRPYRPRATCVKSARRPCSANWISRSTRPDASGKSWIVRTRSESPWPHARAKA